MSVIDSFLNSVKHFGTIDILAHVPLFPRTFRHMDILSLWTFQHRDILAPWTGIHYGTGTFRLRGQKGTRPKCPCAETAILLYMVPEYPRAKMAQTSTTRTQWYQNIPMQKCLNALMFPWQNIHSTKISKCLNVHGE